MDSSFGSPLCGDVPPNFGSACAVLNSSVVSVGGYDCSASQRQQVQLNTSSCICCSERMHLFSTFFCLNSSQVFIGRAASFSQLHDNVMVTSAVPSTMSTSGATIVTLIGTNMCRRNVHLTIESSYSAITHITSKSIVVQTPAGLNRRPSINLTFSLLSYDAQARFHLLNPLELDVFCFAGPAKQETSCLSLEAKFFAVS